MANRREFVAGIASAATAAGLSGAMASPAKPYRVGVVGAGWFGKLNLFSLMQTAPAESVALADVDSEMLTDAAAQTMALSDAVVKPARPPAVYADYREMLSKHEFDIVIVATPDHWHTLPAIAALANGAHVYLEKPIGVDLAEGQALVAAKRKAKRVVQVGTQRRTSSFLIDARERVVRAGLLGEIGFVEVFGYFHQRPKTFPAETAPPANLDWDFYCGPAPKVAYNPGIHPRTWRAYSEFCNGYMGDIGVHFIDACRWLLELGAPKKVSSTAGVYVDSESASTVPDTQIASFEFDTLLMTWTNRQWGRAPDPAKQWGAMIHGDKGTLALSPTGYEFLPRGDGEKLSASLDLELKEFPSDAGRSDVDKPLYAITRSHMRDFIAAIETGREPAAPIEDAHISTACCILANMSAKLGRPLTWDAKKERVIGDDEANRLLARPYRAPWKHPIDH